VFLVALGVGKADSGEKNEVFPKKPTKWTYGVVPDIRLVVTRQMYGLEPRRTVSV
jgi:hypothetical protein